MLETGDLKRIEQKAFRHTLQDGLVELTAGVYLVILAGFLQFTGGVVVALALFFLIGVPLVRHLKNRVTYPRIGYASFAQGDPGKLGLFMLGFLLLGLAAMVTVLVITGDISVARKWYRWMPIFIGIVLSGGFIGLAAISGLVRLWVYALFSVGLGVAWSIPRFEPRMENISFYLLSMGLFLIPWGLILFVLFLRRYPAPAEETSHDVE